MPLDKLLVFLFIVKVSHVALVVLPGLFIIAIRRQATNKTIGGIPQPITAVSIMAADLPIIAALAGNSPSLYCFYFF
jgi:hypothetical protein